MKILVSSCLLGTNCKYNGLNNNNEELKNFLKNHEIFMICPEVEGGLPTPRVPSEILEDKVVNKEGTDVTNHYMEGANKALQLCLDNDIKYAILKANSPSCGSIMVYDGTFSGKLVKGLGITTKLLKEHGITVCTEQNYKEYIK